MPNYNALQLRPIVENLVYFIHDTEYSIHNNASLTLEKFILRAAAEHNRGGGMLHVF